MSTKIYNGYKIQANSLDEAIQRIFEKKSTITDAIHETIHEELINTAIANYYDFYMNLILEIKEMKEMKEDSSSISKLIENDREVVIDCSLLLFPTKKIIDQKSHYLMMLFANNYENIFKEKNIFKELKITEYNYWNNTDCPENITYEEWEKRRLDWDNVLGDDHIPINNSISIQLKKGNQAELIYFKDQKEIQKIWEKVYEKVQKNWDEKMNSLKNYYSEVIEYKIALNAIMKINNITSVEQMDSHQLFLEQRKYKRNKQYTQEEKQQIQKYKEQIFLILEQEFEINNLFEKQSEIENKYKIFSNYINFGKNLENTKKTSSNKKI
jgi:hypothetical protein